MRKSIRLQFIPIPLLAVLLSACAVDHGATVSTKLRLPLDQVNAEGLQGPADGLRALHYEYCIPDEAEAVRAVKAIDPTAEIQRARGRVGCRGGMLLALGNTHQPGFRAVLAKLAALPFVVVIQESYFE